MKYKLTGKKIKIKMSCGATEGPFLSFFVVALLALLVPVVQVRLQLLILLPVHRSKRCESNGLFFAVKVKVLS